ncbi:MAG: hypothetical protein AAF310_04240 [Myxococcota bacterium]
MHASRFTKVAACFITWILAFHSTARSTHWVAYAQQVPTTIVVIAHKDFPTSTKTQTEIKKIVQELFLRKIYRIDAGKRITVIDNKDSGILNRFYSKFIGKKKDSITDIRGRKIRMFKVDDKNLIKAIKSTENSIGYINSNSLSKEDKEKVKILLSLTAN